MLCKTCGAPLSPDDIFCGECGMPVIAERKTMNKCPQCGALVREGEIFCGECGAALSASPTETTVTACPRCGAPTTADMAFCGECGFRLDTPADESECGKTEGIGAADTTGFYADGGSASTTPTDLPAEPEAYEPPEYSAPPAGLKINMPPAKPPLDPTELADKERGKSLFSRPDDADDLL